jgi:hypothetical protein
MKTTMKTMLALTVMVALSFRAHALAINDAGVVGTIKSGEPASIENEVGYINHLLGLNAGTVNDLYADHIYNTSSTEYNGSVTADGAYRLEKDISQGVPNPNFTLQVQSGFDYVLAKYDGPNGGDVLFYLGGASFTLPGNSYDIWTNNADKGYGISHWTAFNAGPDDPDRPHVPDGGTTVAMLGLAFAGLGATRRFLKR